jgi:hypothetical protein
MMEIRTYEDPTLPAGLIMVSRLDSNIGPIIVLPRKLLTGKVVFDAKGEHLDEAVEKLYQNFPVGWLDFVKELKSLRGSIFALKAGGRR